MTYLTQLGASRNGVKISEQQLDQAIRVNQQNDISITKTIGNNRNFISTTSTVLENPTAKLQAAREGMLSDAASSYGQALSSNQAFEDYAYRRQMQIMNTISGVFARPSR